MELFSQTGTPIARGIYAHDEAQMLRKFWTEPYCSSSRFTTGQMMALIGGA